MSRSFVPVLVWAGYLGVLTGLVFVFSPRDPYTYGLLGGAVGGGLLLALLLFARPRRQAALRPVPDLSYATVLLAAGAALALLGWPFGPWLYYPGAGLAALGLGGVVRELRAERRSVG